MLSAILLSALFQPEITADEIAAIFQSNAMEAQTLRVEWVVSRKFTDEARNRHTIALNELQVMLKDAQSDGDRTKIESAIDQAKSGIATSSPDNDLHCHMDYWSDRSNFQARCPYNRKRGGPFSLGSTQSISFPDCEATKDRLAAEFGNIHIISCGEETEQVFRVWEGRQIFEGVQAAYLHSNERRGVNGFFPPLSLPERNWMGVPHLIDVFYRMLTLGDASVLGYVTIDGVETILVQAALNGRTVRGFVDVGRGALPLRVELFLSTDQPTFHQLFDSHVDICERHPKLGPASICRDIEIRKYKDEQTGAFHYPASGLIQECHLATSKSKAISTTLDFISVHEETRWEVHDLEINRPMSSENFALNFPEGTLFTNSDTRETYIAGDVSGNARRFVEGAMDYGTSVPFYKTWAFFSTTVLIVGGATWWFLRRRAVA